MRVPLSTHYASAAKLSLIEAINLALKEVPGTAYKAKLKEKKGYLVYKVSIVSPKKGAIEVKIDPGTGKVLEVRQKHQDDEHGEEKHRDDDKGEE